MKKFLIVLIAAMAVGATQLAISNTANARWGYGGYRGVGYGGFRGVGYGGYRGVGYGGYRGVG